MAELLMLLGLGVGLSVTINKAIRVLLRRVGFGLREPSKKAVLLRQGLLQQALLSKKAPWPDLPPELLGLVLLRMPSHADQIRLCAVCRQWRSSARLQPLPPPLPWLALRDDSFLKLPDGAVHRMPLPGDISYRLSTGPMLFLVHRDGSCCLMNPFSRETTPQQINPDALDLNLCFYGSDRVCKVVVSDHIVAVLTRGGTGAREDCIYFTSERISALHRERKPEDDFLDCIVYNMRDRTVEPLPLETAAALSGTGPWRPTWVFPAFI